MHEIIFEADTFAGKLFDVILLWLILLSVASVMFESVKEYRDAYGYYLDIFEWIITALFSIEYIARIISIKKPWKYIFSFYGLIDLISLLPTYLGIFVGGYFDQTSTEADRRACPIRSDQLVEKKT